MDKKLALVLFAGLAIAGACYWKVTREHPPQPKAEDLIFKQPAPVIPALPDQNSQMVRFERYLGRHEIFVVFFDGKEGAENSDLMELFRVREEELKERGTIVVGVTGALPQEVLGYEESVDERGKPIRRKKDYPFLILTDIGHVVHQNWGLYDEKREQAREGVFYLDRAGNVNFRNQRPLPLSDPEQFLTKLLGESRV